MEKLVNQTLDSFFKNKKVLITGHTGFKGSWLCMLLHKLGADVYGYSLDPPTEPSLFKLAEIDKIVTSTIGDIRDFKKLKNNVSKIKPEIIFHLAAQPLVLESYKNPVETYEINIMGAINLFEAIRQIGGVRVVVNVTTDKCYENKEWHWGYRENEALGGYDPYSSSKACSELVTGAFRNSYFNSNEYSSHGVAIATARAGNVIGGGDWAKDRLIPDFFRSIIKNEPLIIRNPNAIRPWQHVLEPLTGYLILAMKLYNEGTKYVGAWNFGPSDTEVKNVEWIANKICNLWDDNVQYKRDLITNLHEAGYLKLDCSKAINLLEWMPKWGIEKTLCNIVDWYKAYIAGDDIQKHSMQEINEYLS